MAAQVAGIQFDLKELKEPKVTLHYWCSTNKATMSSVYMLLSTFTLKVMHWCAMNIKKHIFLTIAGTLIR